MTTLHEQMLGWNRFSGITITDNLDWGQHTHVCISEVTAKAIIVNCGLLLIWFLLLASVDVHINKSVDWAWQNVLDCVDRFVAVFNLGGRSASRLESAADEVYCN